MYLKKFIKKCAALMLACCLTFAAMPMFGASGEEPTSALHVFENGSAVTAVMVRPDNSRVLYVQPENFEFDGYQWQIFYADKNLWINVNNQTDASIEVNYAMVENAVPDTGVAELRCVLKSAEGVVTAVSDTVNITLGEALAQDGEKGRAVQSVSSRTLLAGAPLLAVDPPKYYTVTIRYTYDTPTSVQLDGTAAFQSYVATILNNDEFTGEFSIHESNPELTGFKPYVKYPDSAEYVQSDSVDKDFTDLDENKVIYVAYRPTTVNYHYRVFFQNTDNDEYTEQTSLYGTKTGIALNETDNTAIVNELIANGSVAGFTSVPSQKLQISADGSTTVNLYFDRLYYLMFFDLDNGGYGTEAVYAKYGETVMVKDPKRSGYVFNGWSKNALRTSVDVADNSGSDYLSFSVPIATTVGGSGVLATFYYAVWTVTTATYNVVYWLENPNDSNYSFLTSKKLSATTGTLVSGSDDLSDSNKNYYIYNGVKTDKNLVVEGDGSTIVNVYYLRKQFALQFVNSSSSSVTTNGTALRSLLTSHTHTDSCYEYVCGVEEHTHGSSCTLTCGLTGHTHTSACCSAEVHTHTSSCYGTPYISYGTNSRANLTAASANVINGVTPQNGVYRTGSTTNRKYYVMYGGSVYQIASNGANFYSGTSYTVKQDLTCTKTEHTHGDGNCIFTNCPSGAHIHNDECYSCGKNEHTHSDACPKRLKCETSSSNAAISGVAYPVNTSAVNSNVVYVIRGKYQQKVGDIWPTIDYVSGSTSTRNLITGLYEWDYNTNNGQLSKKMTLSSDICNLSTFTYTYTYDNGQSITKKSVPVKYVFEELKFGDETVPESYYTNKGCTYTVTYGGKNYRNFYDPIIENDFDQTLNIPSLQHKTIDYVTSAGDGNIDPFSNDKEYLAYNRNTYSVSLFNYNAFVDVSGSYLGSVQYGMPFFMLSLTSGGAKTYLKDYVPSYPENLEAGAFYFDGWYTTEFCLAGTEVDWDNGFVDGPVIFYAKWSPVKHTVKFYEDDTFATEITSDKLGAFTQPEPVEHNGYIGKAPIFDVRDGWLFAGWFYVDETDGNQVKAFDPLNMPVNKDMDLYPVWSSTVMADYEVKYVLQGTSTELADRTTGSMLAGKSKLFYAKGEPQWFSQYVEDTYFPTVSSTSMTISPNSDDNKYTFEYIAMDYVEYTIRYRFEDGTQAAPDEVKQTTSVINDIPSKYIEGYLPDAYEKRLVACSDSTKNIVTFIYSVSTTKAYCHVTYLRQNTDGVGYTEFASVEYIGTIGEPIDVAHLVANGNATGFTYKEAKSTIVTTLAKEGSKLILVYDRNPYQYTVYYKSTSGATLHTPTVDTALYGATVTPQALTISGYKVDGSATQSIRISNTESLNVVTFYYSIGNTQIDYIRITEDFANGYYTLIDPADTSYLGGAVTISAENIKSIGQTATGCDIIPELTGKNFVFAGWYVYDESGDLTVHTAQGDKKIRKVNTTSDSVTLTGSKLTPVANGDGAILSCTYLALFQEAYTTLTIDRSDLEDNEEIIYHVTGTAKYTSETVDLYVTVNKAKPSVKINDVPIGTYTVTEMDSWSWRHDPAAVTNKYVNPLDNTVSFAGAAKPTKWYQQVLKKVNDFVDPIV